jgi:Tol biopolymer transport system component
VRIVRALLATAAACAAACGPPQGPKKFGGEEVRARIVAAERGRAGVVLVFVDENGARVADVTMPPVDEEARSYAVDTQPAWSPDGKWIAFTTTRGRAVGTSIWVVEARAEAEPRLLVEPSGSAIDRDPTWSPESDAIVFASNREGSFDLWRVDLATGKDGWPTVSGKTRRVTDAPTDEVSPAWSPDGKLLAYAVFNPETQRSGIWVSASTGRNPRLLTKGELEQTPAWSPNGRWIAFSAPAARRADMDIFVIRRDGTMQRLAIEDPLAHETEPSWSADGRWLFATAVLRNKETGAPFFWSLVFVDGDTNELAPRVLHDPVAVPRVGFAPAPEPLRTEPLLAHPLYDSESVLRVLEELCRDFDEDERPPACQCLDLPADVRLEACKSL